MHFAPRSAADLLLKAETGLAVYQGSDTEPLVADLLRDIRRLAAAH